MSLRNKRTLPAQRALILAALALTVSACGFQLRGLESTPQALRPLALNCGSNVPSNVCREIRSQLELRQLLVREDESPAYHLRVRNYDQKRRASAITDRAAAAEFELEASIDMTLTSADDVPLLAESRLNAQEVFRGDETRVLAQEAEQQSVTDIVQDRLAQQVVQRLTPFDEDRIQRIRQAHAQKEAEQP